MPTLTEEEIREKIGTGLIDSISIDTSIFDRYGCNLDFPLLRKLDQFKGTATQVVFSEIIVSEVRAHLTKDADEKLSDLSKALKKQQNRWKTSLDMQQILKNATDDKSPKDFADEKLENYIALVSGIVISARDNQEVTGKVIDRYFECRKPFEKKEAKKNEFPDAFALLSLEQYAAARGKLMLCVSTDKGWLDFAAESECLACVSFR